MTRMWLQIGARLRARAEIAVMTHGLRASAVAQ